ncbi:MAG: HAD family hydrolase [Candidatus Thorarchaeota archaeon]
MVFDLHGVLADSQKLLEFYDEEFIRILGKADIEAARAVKIHREFLDWWIAEARKIYKDSSEQVIAEMFELNGRYEQKMLAVISQHTGEDPQEYYQDIESRTFEFNAASRGNASYPEVKPALDELQQSWPKLALHVASNAHTSHVRGTLTGASLTGYFKQILGYDRIGFQKRHPKYWSRLLQLISGTSDETIFVGDSAVEVQGCAQLGMPCIIVDRHNIFDASSLGHKHFLIENLHQILELLPRLEFD